MAFLRDKTNYTFSTIVTLMLLSLAICPDTLRAQSPEVTFLTPGPIAYKGTPGSMLRFPVMVQAGSEGAKSLSLSIEPLVHQDQAGQVILSDAVVFAPASFDMPPNSQRQVWVTLGALPTVPGVYVGALLAEAGITFTVQSKVSVSLTVEFATLRAAPPITGALKIQGWSDDLQESIRLQSVGGDVSGITLAPGKLTSSGGPGYIMPEKVTMLPVSLDLKKGESRLVTLQVDGKDARPGEYQGLVQFPQANQPLSEAYSLTLTVHVLAKPALTLPQGDAITAQLVRCSPGLDCWVAERLLPLDYRQETLPLQTSNADPNAVMITKIQPAIARIGQVNVMSVVDLLQPVTRPVTIAAQSSQDVDLAISKTFGPGHYKGKVTLYLTDEQGRAPLADSQEVSIDVNIRSGPLLAMALLVLGVLAGRVLQSFSSEQNRLLRLHYNLRWRARSYENKLSADAAFNKDRERIEADARALRDLIYDQKLDKVEEQLRALGQRPQRLLVLKEALPAIAEACNKQKLDEASSQLLIEAGNHLRARIHADETLDVAAEVQAITARAEAMLRLRELEGRVEKSVWDKAQKDRMLDMVAKARDALVGGDDKAAQSTYDNVYRACELLPEIQQTRQEAEKQLAQQPDRLTLIRLELDMAGQAISQLEFEIAKSWLNQARLTLTGWQQSPTEAGEEMGHEAMPWDAAASGALAQTVDRLFARMASWQPLAFLGDPAQVRVAQPLPLSFPRLRDWFIERWSGLSMAFWPEVNLWLGMPLISFVTILLAAWIGFQNLYVTQGKTFGADPANDYLTLFLWGLTSDVVGATVSKLADLSKAK